MYIFTHLQPREAYKADFKNVSAGDFQRMVDEAVAAVWNKSEGQDIFVLLGEI